jgi:multiple sugar transport system substrate-binding protein
MKNFIVLILTLFFISCASDVDKSFKKRFENETPKRVHLKYWCSANPQEIELAKKLTEKWNELHPDIQVEVQPLPAGQSSEEILLAAIAGGTTPDVCSNIWPGAIAEYVKAGGLVRLDEFEDFDSVISARKIPRDLLESFRSSDGHFYQFPWKTNPILLLYNVKIFKEAGVEKPPVTYSEFFSVCEKIKNLKIGVYPGYTDTRPIWWQRFFDFYPLYISASGGKTFFKNGELKIDTASAEKVFNFFKTCFERNYFPITNFQVDPFLTGKIAMRFTGPWTISYLERNKPLDFEYSFAPVPVPDDYRGEVYTYGDPKNIAIFSSTKHKKEAWEFVKFLISEEADLLLLEICNQLPIRGDLLENQKFENYFNRNQRMKMFARQSAFTRGVDEAPEMKEIFDAISHEFEACSVYGAKSEREAVRNLVKRIKVILEWSK